MVKSRKKKAQAKPKRRRGHIWVKGFKTRKGVKVKGYWRKKPVKKKGKGLGGKEKEKGPFDQIKMYRYGLYVNAVPVHSKPWARRYVSVKVWGYSDHPDDTAIEAVVAERFEKVLAKALESAQYAKDIIHGGADYSAGIERWREIGFAGRSLIGFIDEKVEWS